MNDKSIAEKIAAFLAEPVPGSSSSPGATRNWWMDWNERAASFGPNAPVFFIQALAEGNQNAQYGAVLALRHYSYEVWAEGDGDDEIYKVRKVGENDWTYIVPKIKQSDDPGITVTAIKP